MTREAFQFTRADYDDIHALVFRGDFPGYTPAVTEIPNGDGKADADKRYAHVSLKNLRGGWGTADERNDLLAVLMVAHSVAECVYDALGGPPAFRPDVRYGALRVLEYPPGAISNEHVDFDLFTLHMFRDRPECFHRQYGDVKQLPDAALLLNPGLHLGELAEEIGLGGATRHSVSASVDTQRAIVYFAIPDHDVRLVEGERGGSPTVRDFLNERMARSRTAFAPYGKAGA